MKRSLTMKQVLNLVKNGTVITLPKYKAEVKMEGEKLVLFYPNDGFSCGALTESLVSDCRILLQPDKSDAAWLEKMREKYSA